METGKERYEKETRKWLRNLPWAALEEWGRSDQHLGVEPPLLEKAIPDGAKRIDLVPADQTGVDAPSLTRAISERRSRRKFTEEELSLEDLSYLLWATQGIREIHPKRVHAFRTVPSGGCRHPFETYLFIHRVEGVPVGLWRYSALEHALISIWDQWPIDAPSLTEACNGQSWIDSAAVTFVWAVIPYRTEWRYGPDSLKDILLSCGHVCQNLYLACESIGAGTCAVVAYDQEKMDALLGIDGFDELALYVAPVGKVDLGG